MKKGIRGEEPVVPHLCVPPDKDAIVPLLRHHGFGCVSGFAMGSAGWESGFWTCAAIAPGRGRRQAKTARRADRRATVGSIRTSQAFFRGRYVDVTSWRAVRDRATFFFTLVT